MELSARELIPGMVLETDVCIVGGGPAGLTLAGELAGGAMDVILLESGGEEPVPRIQALNDGDVVGDAYAGLQVTRHRQLGGTSCIWNTLVRRSVGAKYAPLDAIDLEERPSVDRSGWPFDHAELLPYYARAQQICGLGPLDYDAGCWTRGTRALLPPAGPHLVSRVYQLGTRAELVAANIIRLRSVGNVRLCCNTTVLRLVTDGTGRRVVRAEAGSPGGARWTVRAKHFVLACGAVENPRLLLASGDSPEGLGNRYGWVGRCFMEHPRDRSITLTPRAGDSYREWSFYDTHTATDGTCILGRLALSGDAVRSGELPNASATLLARLTPRLERVRDALGARRLLRPIGHWLVRGGHGWSRHPAPSRVLAGFTLLLNVEQEPHADNRVLLGSRRDAFGSPLPELHWRWRPADQRRLERLRAVVAGELEAMSVGRVTVARELHPDPNAHHHAGTTRMHASERGGVLDPNGRVHALENLYVTGASAFPTAGFANPVLTIVALAVRLAEHLEESL